MELEAVGLSSATTSAPLVRNQGRSLGSTSCLLLADDNLMEVSGGLVLHSLHVRLGVPRSGSFKAFIHVKKKAAKLWMMGVTLQGNGNGVQDCIDCGMSVYIGAYVYAEGGSLFLMSYIGPTER